MLMGVEKGFMCLEKEFIHVFKKGFVDLYR